MHLLPEEQIQVSPLLLGARGWILQAMVNSMTCRAWLTAAEQLLATSDRDDE